MAKAQPIIPILDRLNMGGLADSKYSGIKNSVYKLVGFDLHSEPGKIKVRQKLTKDSGSVVDSFAKVPLEASNGDKYFFSSTSGKVWKVGSPYTVAYTTVPAKGGAGCLGAFEYDGYVYWATEKRLHRIPVSGLSDWATNAQLDWQALNLDQDQIGGTGQTYQLQTSIAEGATHRQTFIPATRPIEAIAVYVAAKGTGNWTLTIHDSSNNSIAAVTIASASIPSSGILYFDLSSVWYPTLGTTYHFHITVSTGTSTIVSNVSSDHEGAQANIYTTSDSEFHPMLDLNEVLYIGDRHFIHQVETQSDGSHLFSRAALDMNAPFRTKCLGFIGTDLLIGTIISSTVARARMYRWNTWAVSFSSVKEIREPGINAFLASDEGVFVQTGISGKTYYYNGDTLKRYKRIPGTYSPSHQAVVHPNAVGNLDGLMLIGLSTLAGTPTEMGVYVLGNYDAKYPYVLDLSFPISERSGDDLVLNSIEIGAILVSGLDLYVSWKNGSTYGVDKLNYSAKLEAAYIETRLMIIRRDVIQNWSKFSVAYCSLPASTAITIAYQTNHSGSYTPFAAGTEAIDDTDRHMILVDKVINSNVLQVKVSTTVNGNNSPEIESGGVMID